MENQAELKSSATGHWKKTVVNSVEGIWNYGIGLLPASARARLEQPLKKRIIWLVIYLLIGSLLGWRQTIYLFGWWLGGFVGFFLLDLDYLLDVYILRPKLAANVDIQTAVRRKDWSKAWEIMLAASDNHRQLLLHSVIFEVILMLLVMYTVTSSGSLFAKGLILALALRLLLEQLFEFFKTGKIQAWFWQIRGQVSPTVQKLFLVIGWGIWVVFSLGVM